MNTMTQKMSEASDQSAASHPKKGEKFRCVTCGMELQITADCRCKGPESAHFQCCGKQLSKA